MTYQCWGNNLIETNKDFEHFTLVLRYKQKRGNTGHFLL